MTYLRNRLFFIKKAKITMPFSFFVAFFFLSAALMAQNKSVDNPKSLNYQLAKLDTLIEKKAFNAANTLLTFLKNSKEYKVQNNRLQINFREAEILYGTKRPEESLSLLLKNFDKIDNNPKLYELYANQLGRLFYAAKNYPKTIAYYKIALNSVINSNNTERILKYNLSIGRAFFKNKLLDSAKIYYKRNIKYPLTKKTNPIISKTFNNLVAIAIRQNNYKEASEYSLQSIKINEQNKDTLGTGFSLVNLGNIYYGEKDFKKAGESYLKAYNLIKTDSSRSAERLKRDALYNLSFAYQEMGDFKKAFTCLSQSKDLADKISQEDQAENLSEIEAKYNVAQKEKDIEIQKAKNITTTILFISFAVLMLLIMISGIVFYKNFRLKQQNKLKAVLNESQVKILNATIDAKEQERKTIAAILHDSVSALLSSANLHLQASKSQLKGTPPVEIKKAQDIVSEASVKIRDLSHDLISSVLIKFGLAFAVHDLCQKYSNSEIFFHSQDNNIERYDQDFEIKIHSIIEELINNVLKHSQAKNATVVLIQRADKKLVVQIVDDGVGFDVKKAKLKDGLGLSHIEARIKMLKGRFIINSEKGEGSDISIIVPIKFKEESVN
jgi:two-component system, NarL family, sensor kinase